MEQQQPKIHRRPVYSWARPWRTFEPSLPICPPTFGGRSLDLPRRYGRPTISTPVETTSSPICRIGTWNSVVSLERLEGLHRLQQLSCLGCFVRLEGLEGIISLEDLEAVEGIENLDPLERRSWASGCFYQILASKQPRKTKTGLEKK